MPCRNAPDSVLYALMAGKSWFPPGPMKFAAPGKGQFATFGEVSGRVSRSLHRETSDCYLCISRINTGSKTRS